MRLTNIKTINRPKSIDNLMRLCNHFGSTVLYPKQGYEKREEKLDKKQIERQTDRQTNDKGRSRKMRKEGTNEGKVQKFCPTEKN